MDLLVYLIVFSLIGGVLSLAGGVALLLWRKKLLNYQDKLTSFAAGVLIAVSVLDLLPESFASGNSEMVAIFTLIGILFLFVLEKTQVWFHHHHEPHGIEPNMVGVWLGDTLHNFIDGLAIGAAFLISIPTGISTSVAVAMHELPQEVADFSLYLKAGFTAKKTLSLNLLSSLATFLGALGIFWLGDKIAGAEIYILALTAGMFLYIALADLVPELHEEHRKLHATSQLIIFLFGVLVTYLSIALLG